MRSLSESDLKSIRYDIITGDLSQHDAYRYWLSKWPELVKSLGSKDALTADDFLRQDKLTVLSLNGEIAAIHMLSYFERKEFHKFDYFTPYGPQFLKALDDRNVKKVQTLQWLMADENFGGYGLGSVIVCLSLRNQLEEKADASVTIARADNSVTNLAVKAGMEVITTDVMHNVPVSHMACFTPKVYPKPSVANLVDHYWSKRNYSHIETRTGKKAA